MHAVTHGMTRRQIAEGRGISIAGVKYHLASVTTKLGIGGRVALRHWFAAPKGSALARQLARRKEQTMTTMTSVELGRIGQISRSVADVARSESWYRDVLGLKHLYTFGPLAFFDCAGTRLALMQKDAPSKDESVVYLAVDELVPAVDALKARGVHFINAPHRIHTHADGTEEWMAFFEDLEGRPLALMSRVTP